MSEDFDPYLQWLGIRDPERPPNHYRLLGIDLFEDDPDVLVNAADRQMAHVRTFQTGKHSAESQTLLNELAAAKICLLNAQKKAEYDANLRAQQTAEAGSSVTPPPVQPPVQPPPVEPPVVFPLFSVPPPEIVTDQPPPSIVTDRPPEIVQDGPAEIEPAPTERAAAVKRSPPAVLTAILLLGLLILVLAGLIVIVRPGGAAKKEPSKKVAATNDSDTTSKPEPKPEPEPKPGLEPDPKDLPPAAESIVAARAAMRLGDLPAAARCLQMARQKAADANQRNQIEQLRTVLDYLEGFQMALNQALAALQLGDKLTVGDGRVTVIEVKGDELVVEVDRQRKPYTRGTLPSQLALAIAGPRLPDVLDSSLLCKAAVLIFDPSGDWELAKELCRKAKSRGLPTGELLAELKLASESAQRAPEPPKPEPPKPEPPKPPGQQRLAVPSAAAQSEALNKIRKLFKKDYAGARERNEKRELAKLLRETATGTKDDPVARYVLLAEARDQSVAAGDSQLFLMAATQMGKEYQLDWQTMAVATLHELAKRTRTPQANRAMVRIALFLARTSGSKNDFDVAALSAEAARDMARKARDTSLTREAVSMMKDVAAWRELHEDFLEAEKILAERPDDPQANLVGGKYHCFVKGDWTDGLPMLRGGSDPRLASLAEAEQRQPREATKMAALGDRWYEAAGKVDQLTRRLVQHRAVYWYRRALRDRKLTGLSRTVTQRRLEELGGG